MGDGEQEDPSGGGPSGPSGPSAPGKRGPPKPRPKKTGRMKKTTVKRSSILRACPKCMIITDLGACPICGSRPSRNWQGYMVLVDCTTSMIGERVGYRCDPKVLAAIEPEKTPEQALADLGVDRGALTAPDDSAREGELRKIRSLLRCSRHCDMLAEKLEDHVRKSQISGTWRYALRVR